MSGALARIAALLAAALLVTGAWFVRDRVIEDNTGDARDAIADGRDLVVACDPAVALCKDLADRFADGLKGVKVRVELPGRTTERFVSDDDAPDLWITSDLWPSIVQSSEQQSVDVSVLSEPFGEISLFGVATPPKLAVLGGKCPDLTAGCIAALAGSAWGEPDVASALADRFDIGIDPAGSTGNLLTIANATAEWSGVERPDIDDFAATRSRLAAVLRASVPVSSRSTAASEFASTPAAFDLVTTTDGSTRVGGNQLEPFPMGGYRSSVVLVGRSTVSADDGVDTLRSAFDELGVEISVTADAKIKPGTKPNGPTLEAMWRAAEEAS